MNWSKTLLIFLALVCSAPLMAQDDSAQIHQVILNIFDGMREGDSAKVHRVFHPSVRIYSSFTSKNGEEKIHTDGLAGFLKAIGTPHDQVWNESISNTVIQIDGNIAQVWTHYQFHVDTTFSHCGVDAFQLLKVEGQWQVIQLMDTRRMKGCPSSKK